MWRKSEKATKLAGNLFYISAWKHCHYISFHPNLLAMTVRWLWTIPVRILTVFRCPNELSKPNFCPNLMLPSHRFFSLPLLYDSEWKHLFLSLEWIQFSMFHSIVFHGKNVLFLWEFQRFYDTEHLTDRLDFKLQTVYKPLCWWHFQWIKIAHKYLTTKETCHFLFSSNS